MTVLQKQCLLTYLGYDTGGVDGIEGPKTIAAMAKFVSDYGLSVLSEDKQIQSLLVAVDGTISKAASSTSESTSNTVQDASASASSSSTDWWSKYPNFNRSEFVCKCGGKYCNGDTAEMEEKLIAIAQRMRNSFGKPVNVSSGVRCPQHNTDANGVSNSRHLLGKAMDFSISGESASNILKWTQSQSDLSYSYAIDGSYVHMDIL